MKIGDINVTATTTDPKATIVLPDTDFVKIAAMKELTEAIKFLASRMRNG